MNWKVFSASLKIRSKSKEICPKQYLFLSTYIWSYMGNATIFFSQFFFRKKSSVSICTLISNHALDIHARIAVHFSQLKRFAFSLQQVAGTSGTGKNIEMKEIRRKDFFSGYEEKSVFLSLDNLPLMFNTSKSSKFLLYSFRRSKYNC